jgi:hypothetical protein
MNRHAAWVSLVVVLVARPEAAPAGGCTIQSCGGNSPEVFGNPIGALKVVGTRAIDGLVPGSLRPSAVACPDHAVATTLRVRHGELVAVDAAGRERCSGHELVGAEFELWVKGTRRRLAISEVGAVETWQRPPARSEVVATYRLTDALYGPSICPLRTATWMDPWQIANLLGPPVVHVCPAAKGCPDCACPPASPRCDPARTCQWTEATDHAFIVQGEAYGEAGDVKAAGADWFNVACPGTALAKMRLLGFDPMPKPTSPLPPTTAPERVTTLKMLTARYDGVKSSTMEGQPLKWIRADGGIEYYGDPATWGPIEARWDPRGASCVSHLRRWMAPIKPGGTDAQAAASEEARRTMLARRPRGGTILACSPSPPATPPLWTTFTVDHVHAAP